MTTINSTQNGLQAALSILTSQKQKQSGVTASAEVFQSTNPQDEVKLSSLAQQMMKLRDANKAPEGAPTATVGVVRAANGQELMQIQEHGRVIINSRAVFEMLGGDWADVEARLTRLEEMSAERRGMSPSERMIMPRLPGRPGGQSMSEYLYGAEFAAFSESMRGSDSIESALAKIQAFMPSGTGYTIEAAFERPQMPVGKEDAELAATKAAADAWRKSRAKEDD